MLISLLSENALTLISLAIACLALWLSSLIYYRNFFPFALISPSCSVKKGKIYNHLTTDSLQLSDEQEFLIIGFKIVNSLPFNVALFNIRAVATHSNHSYAFYRKFSHGLKDDDSLYLIGDDIDTQRLNIPYSDFQNFPPSSFSYFNIVINFDDIKKSGSSKITVFFRDTRFKFIKKGSCKLRCCKLKGLSKMRNPCHCFHFDVSDFL